MASTCSSRSKTKRVVLTIDDKLKICQLVKAGRTLQKVADEYNIGKSTVHDITKSEEKLKAFQKEVAENDCIKKRKTVKQADFSELDKGVYLWFIQQRCKGTYIYVYTHHSIVRYLSSGACKFSSCDGFPSFIFAGTPISGPLLMSKALQLYPLVYADDPNPSTFKAGTGWLKNFKDRHGIRALSVQGELLSAAADSVECFKETLAQLIEKKITYLESSV